MKNFILNKILKYKTIKHYKRMINWAKKQPLKNFNNEQIMLEKIGENWYGDNCPYCKKYFKTWCNEDCPLHTTNLQGKCCDGLWMKMARSNSWKEWIMNAEEVLKYIKLKG